MQSVRIEKVTMQDLETLTAISRKTFADAFATQNNATDFAKYLAENLTSAKLRIELENPDSAFFFAMLSDKVVGYLKVNYRQAQSELHDLTSLEIERIYVLAGFQGKKIGQQLLDFALRLAHDQKCSYAWLGVWEKNSRAIRFYERNGFAHFDQHTFYLGNDAQTDLLMKRPPSP